jgi:hypothetical protein
MTSAEIAAIATTADGQLPIWDHSDEDSVNGTPKSDSTSAINDEEEPPKPVTVFDQITDMASMVVSIRKGFGLRTEDSIAIVNTALNYILAREQMRAQQPPWAQALPETPETQETSDDQSNE